MLRASYRVTLIKAHERRMHQLAEVGRELKELQEALDRRETMKKPAEEVSIPTVESNRAPSTAPTASQKTGRRRGRRTREEAATPQQIEEFRQKAIKARNDLDEDDDLSHAAIAARVGKAYNTYIAWLKLAGLEKDDWWSWDG
jgi:hypothetical protein